MRTIAPPKAGEWAGSSKPLGLDGEPWKEGSKSALAWQDEKDRNNLREAARLRKGDKK